MIEKFLVLAVLRDGRFRSAREIAGVLEKDFGLKFRANTVRKDLDRYRGQYLVRREKMSGSRRCWHYRITEKGLGRYEYFLARLQKAPSTEVCPSSDGEAERKNAEDSLRRQTVHALSTIRICDATLKLAGDQSVRDLASNLRFQSMMECVEMFPRMPMDLQVTSCYLLCRSCNDQAIQRDDGTKFLLMRLVLQRNDEIAFLLKVFLEAEEDRDRYRKLCDEADSRDRRMGSRVEILEDKVNAAYLRSFKLGVACGSHQMSLELTVAQSDTLLSLLRRQFEKEQMERERLDAIQCRRSMNLRWWDMLPTAPVEPSFLR